MRRYDADFGVFERDEENTSASDDVEIEVIEFSQLHMQREVELCIACHRYNHSV